MMKKVIFHIFILFSPLFSATVDQTHSIQATFNVTRNDLVIRQNIEWVNTSDQPVNTLYLRLDNSASHKNPSISDTLNHAYHLNEFQSSQHTVQKITDNYGPLVFEPHSDEALRKQQTFNHQNLIKVILPTPIAPNERKTLTIQSTKKIPATYQTNESYTFDQVSVLRFLWYPVIVNSLMTPDTYHQFVRHHVSKFALSVNEPTTIGLSATSIQTSTQNDHTTVTASWDTPIHGIGVVMSPKYKIWRDTTENGTNIQLLYLNTTPLSVVKTLSQDAMAAIEYYTALYGPLPYPTITLSQSPIPGLWGMAINGHAILGNSLFSPNTKLEWHLFRRLQTYVIAHELAHLWSGFDMNFGHNNALSEGLTEYMSYGFFNHYYGHHPRFFTDTRLLLANPLLGLGISNDYQDTIIYNYQVNLKNKWDEPLSYPFHVSNLNAKSTKDYDKALLFFSSLSVYIGTKNMTEAIRKYSDYNHSDRSFKSFQAIISQISTQNTTSFFQHWAFEAATADVLVSAPITTQNNGFDSVISIQKTGTAPMAVPITITYKDGTTDTDTLWNPTSNTQLRVHHKAPITSIALDPDMQLMETNRFNNFYPKKETVYTGIDMLRGNMSPLDNHRTMDATQLYVMVPYIMTMPSLFSEPSLMGVQVSKTKALDYSIYGGIGLNAINNYDAPSLFAGYTRYLAKQLLVSGVIQYDFDNAVVADIGVLHPIYEKIDHGFYGHTEATLSSIGYGFSQQYQLSTHQTFQAMFLSWSYQNMITAPAIGNARIEWAPQGIFNRYFHQLTASYQPFYSIRPQLLFAPQITIGTGRNAPGSFSEMSLRGVTTDTLHRSTMAKISLNTLFPIIRFSKDQFRHPFGYITGVNGQFFYEMALFPQTDNKKQRVYQTIGIEFGVANTLIFDMPLSISLGYARTIATPSKSDQEVYVDLGMALNVFHSLYTY
ncbi:MAG: M1 family aminopeptidase [Candidatus Marinamargulisbacteria bacterium]